MKWLNRFKTPPPPLKIFVFVLEMYDAILGKWIMYDKGFLTDVDARQFAAEQCAKRSLTWDVVIGEFGDQALSEYFVKPGYDISRFRISRITLATWQSRT